MKKLIFIALIITFALMNTSCLEDENIIEVSLLEKSWSQSYEENTSEFNIYRPSYSTDFPQSRYRQVLNIKENNTCDYLVLAPNDAHYFKNGSWEYDEKTNILKIFTDNFDVLYVFKVIELKHDFLKLKINNP